MKQFTWLGRHAHRPQFGVGDLVTSRWSSSGAVWCITEMTGEKAPYGGGEIVVIRALRADRSHRRASSDLRKAKS